MGTAHAQNAVMWLALSKRSVVDLQILLSCAIVSITRAVNAQMRACACVHTQVQRHRKYYNNQWWRKIFKLGG